MLNFFLSEVSVLSWSTVLGAFSQCAGLSFARLFPAGSVYRDEFDLAILKMQEDNRLEILKRKWWDGGKCPKEEDHRAKGSSLVNPHLLVLELHSSLLQRVFGT